MFPLYLTPKQIIIPLLNPANSNPIYISGIGTRNCKCIILSITNSGCIIYCGYYYCFTCGSKGNFSEFVAECFDIPKTSAEQ